jgi:hypothetical protein
MLVEERAGLRRFSPRCEAHGKEVPLSPPARGEGMQTNALTRVLPKLRCAAASCLNPFFSTLNSFPATL